MFRNSVITARKRNEKKKNNNHEINYTIASSIAECRQSARINLIFFEIFLELQSFFSPLFQMETCHFQNSVLFLLIYLSPRLWQVNWPRISELMVFYGRQQRGAGLGKYSPHTPRKGVSSLSIRLTLTFKG